MVAEIERLRKELQLDEDKLKKKYEEECQLLEENLQKEIDLEKNYIENCTEIEIGKLKEEVEARIEEINKNRYQGLGDNEVSSNIENNEQKWIKIEQEMAKDREIFERERKERHARFNEQMKILLRIQDTKQIEYLKKEIIPLVKTSGMINITDETILETRYRLKITRNAIRSGHSFALYKARFQDKPVVCRVGVLAKIPNEIRMNLNNSAKCHRFLCEKPALDYFLKLHEIFATEQKMYVIMDEVSSTNMFNIVQRTKSSDIDIKKWFIQICEALNFMHKYAISHLNLKLENVVFSENNDVRIVGLSRAFCYFNLDQEKFIKAPKVPSILHYDHLPSECFEDEFDPLKADVWSFGLLIYESVTKINPRRLNLKEKNKPNLNKLIDNKDWKNPLFNFDKVKPPSLRNLLQMLLDTNICVRPNFNEVLSLEYVKSDT